MQVSPQQHYLNTGCDAKELVQLYGLSTYEAYKAMNEAITIAKHQRKLELCIQSGEDLVPENDIANYKIEYK